MISLAGIFNSTKVRSSLNTKKWNYVTVSVVYDLTTPIRNNFVST